MSDEHDLLDEALGALREDALDPSDATLGRILESLDGDGLLDEACAALRTQPSEGADAQTLERIHATLAGPRVDTLDEAVSALRQTKARPGRARWAIAVAAAALLAVGLGGPTAWAMASGRMPAILASFGIGPSVEPPEPDRPRAPRSSAAPRIEPPRIAVPPSEPEIEPEIEPADPEPARPVHASTAPVRAARPPSPIAPAPVGETPVAEASPEDPVAPDPDSPETRSFAAAHDAHFRGGDPHVALRLWDAHLAAHPRGRFELEARYNRALTLLRLGRLDDARLALAPYAEGAHGAYRRAEATRLIEAIDARQNP